LYRWVEKYSRILEVSNERQSPATSIATFDCFVTQPY
jgi:hypothetical protein